MPRHWEMRYTTQARKDAKKLKKSPLAGKAKEILELLQHDPFATPPPFEALIGDLRGAYSRRLNIQHRIAYEVLAKERVIKILRLWTHYD